MPDPKIIKTQVTNPDGSVTYKQSWSSSSTKSSSSNTKSVPKKSSEPSKQTTFVRQTSSVSKPIAKSSGIREITTIAPMKPVGRTNADIKAEIPKIATKKPETLAESRLRKYGPVGERVYGKGEKKEKYITPDYVGKKKSSKTVKICKNC